MANPSGREQVEALLERLEHPLKREIEMVRGIITNLKLNHEEHVKWNAPSYRYNGDDRVTFNFHGKGMFRLVLHRGAKIKEAVDLRPHFEEAGSMLEWAAPDRMSIRFTSMADVEAKRDMLRAVIARWVELTR